MHRLAILAVFALVACSKNDPGPTCDQVVDHVLEVTKETMVGHDGTMGKAIRSQMIAECEQRHFSKEERQCEMAAKDSATLVACYRKGPPPPPPPRPPAGMTPPPKPESGSATGSGSSGTPTP